MSTSVMVSFLNGRNHYGFSRNACFGEMNRQPASSTPNMEVMEWHPTSAGSANQSDPYAVKSPRKALEFIDSFGMWEDIFHLTTINTVAGDLANNPADALITGFMSMRDYAESGRTLLFSSDNVTLDAKIEFALYCCGIYRERRGSVSVFTRTNPSYGEMGTCYLNSNDDAFGMYLLAFGTKEEFEGCWAQSAIGRGSETMNGYVRNNSDANRQRVVSTRRPGWNGLADWLRTWLRSNPEAHTSKLGRMTVQQACDRLSSRVLGDMTYEQQRDAVLDFFSELRDMYLS